MTAELSLFVDLPLLCNLWWRIHFSRDVAKEVQTLFQTPPKILRVVALPKDEVPAAQELAACKEFSRHNEPSLRDILSGEKFRPESPVYLCVLRPELAVRWERRRRRRRSFDTQPPKPGVWWGVLIWK